MMIDLSDDELTLVLRALDQYNAYLVATQRNDTRYMTLAERLKFRENSAGKLGL